MTLDIANTFSGTAFQRNVCSNVIRVAINLSISHQPNEVSVVSVRDSTRRQSDRTHTPDTQLHDLPGATSAALPITSPQIVGHSHSAGSQSELFYCYLAGRPNRSRQSATEGGLKKVEFHFNRC